MPFVVYAVALVVACAGFFGLSELNRSLGTYGGAVTSYGHAEDVETLQEQTGSDYSMTVWRGIAGPKDMDATVVEELECHLGLIAESDSFNDFMTDSGLGVKYANAEDFQALMAEDDAKKGEVMKEAGLAK